MRESKVSGMILKLLHSEVEMKKYLTWCKRQKMIVDPIIWAAHFGCKRRMGVLIRYFEKSLKHQRETYLNDKRMILQRTYNQLRIPSKLGLIDRSFLRKYQKYKKCYGDFIPMTKEPNWMKSDEYIFVQDKYTLRTLYLSKKLSSSGYRIGNTQLDSSEISTDSDEVGAETKEKYYVYKIWKCKNKNQTSNERIEWNSSSESVDSRSDIEEDDTSCYLTSQGSRCSHLDSSRASQYALVHSLTSLPSNIDSSLSQNDGYTSNALDILEDINGDEGDRMHDGESPMMFQRGAEDINNNCNVPIPSTSQSEDIGYESSFFTRLHTAQKEGNEDQIIPEESAIINTGKESGAMYTSEIEMEETVEVAQFLEAEDDRCSSSYSTPGDTEVLHDERIRREQTELLKLIDISSTSSKEQNNNEEQSTSTLLPPISKPAIHSGSPSEVELFETNGNLVVSSEYSIDHEVPTPASSESATSPGIFSPSLDGNLSYPTSNDPLTAVPSEMKKYQEMEWNTNFRNDDREPQRFTNDDLANLILENIKSFNERRTGIMSHRNGYKGNKEKVNTAQKGGANKKKNKLSNNLQQSSTRNKILKHSYRNGKKNKGGHQQPNSIQKLETSNDGKEVSSKGTSGNETSII